jgi:hypothetical protein
MSPPCASPRPWLAVALVLTAACVSFRPRAELADGQAPGDGRSAPDAREASAAMEVGALPGERADARPEASAVVDAVPRDVPADSAAVVADAARNDVAAAEARPPADAAPTPTPPVVVQLVVGDPGVLGAGDTRLRTVLAGRGLTVRLRDDGSAVDLTDTALVVIAGSVEAASVGNKYRDVAVPVIVLEYSLYDDMGMTGAVENFDFGTSGATTLQILDPGSDLAAGLSGVVTTVTEATNFGWGNPPGADRVASLPGMADRVAIFAFASGATMVGSRVAPANRVGFFALESAAARLSDSGVSLFAAAIDWALGR